MDFVTLQLSFFLNSKSNESLNLNSVVYADTADRNVSWSPAF